MDRKYPKKAECSDLCRRGRQNPFTFPEPSSSRPSERHQTPYGTKNHCERGFSNNLLKLFDRYNCVVVGFSGG